jgi:hypothetical protein
LTDTLNIVRRLENMEVHLKRETELRLHDLASKSGRPTDDLIEDAMTVYLAEVTELRSILDGRFDDIQSGRVKPVDGEAFFEDLRRRDDDLLKKQSPK